jgi:hypothetical protein
VERRSFIAASSGQLRRSICELVGVEQFSTEPASFTRS